MFYDKWIDWKKEDDLEKMFVYYECEKNKKRLVDKKNIRESLIKVLGEHEDREELRNRLMLWLDSAVKRNQESPLYFFKDFVSEEGYFSFSGTCLNDLNDDLIEIGTQLTYEMIKGAKGFERVKRNKKNTKLLKQGGMIERVLEYEEDRMSGATPIEKIMFEECKKLEEEYPIRVELEHKFFVDEESMYTHALDVAIFRKGETMPFLDVETDGLSFHKGFQNMRLDRERDRRLLLNNVLTMRYTSREVFNNIESAVEEIRIVIEKNI